GHPVEPGRVREVLGGRHLLEEARLDRDAVDQQADCTGLGEHVVAEHARLAAFVEKQGREQADQRRLARAVLAQDGDALAVVDLVAAAEGVGRGNGASGLAESWGFFVGPSQEASMSELELRHYVESGVAPRETLEWAGETQAKMVDLKFCDLLGTWQHMTLPLSAFDESAFDEGLGFDGSSIRGWQGISESDMLLMPDASSAVLDPFAEAPTLSVVCEIADPLTHEPYGKDPRR